MVITARLITNTFLPHPHHKQHKSSPVCLSSHLPHTDVINGSLSNASVYIKRCSPRYAAALLLVRFHPLCCHISSPALLSHLFIRCCHISSPALLLLTSLQPLCCHICSPALFSCLFTRSVVTSLHSLCCHICSPALLSHLRFCQKTNPLLSNGIIC